MRAVLLALAALAVSSQSGCHIPACYYYDDCPEDVGCFPGRMRTLSAEIAEQRDDGQWVRIEADFDANASHMALAEHEVDGLVEIVDQSGGEMLWLRGLVPTAGDGLVSISAEVACFVDESVRVQLAYVWDVSAGDVEIPIGDLIVPPGPFDDARAEPNWPPRRR